MGRIGDQLLRPTSFLQAPTMHYFLQSGLDGGRPGLSPMSLPPTATAAAGRERQSNGGRDLVLLFILFQTWITIRLVSITKPISS